MRHTPTSISSSKIAVAAALAFAGSSVGAIAPAVAQGLPSYATGEESIKGRIVSVDGKDRLALRDDRGFVDNVSLHDGTIINPTGLRLAAGQAVTILGHANGKTFEANEIDTPYARYPAEPVGPYDYGYAPYGYAVPYAYAPYPVVYGYPYSYYGARFGFGLRGRGFAIGGRI